MIDERCLLFWYMVSSIFILLHRFHIALSLSLPPSLPPSPASSLPSVGFLASLLAFSAVHYSIYEAVILVQSFIASIMAFSSCLSHSPLLAFKTIKPCNGRWQTFPFLTRRNNAGLSKAGIVRNRVNLSRDWTFIGGSRVTVKPKVGRTLYSKSSGTYASWLSGPQLASSVFTLGTVAVLPFYTLMVLAPKSELTKRSMESSIPYIVLGVLYGYLLYLSWTPETVRLIFANKYLLPELTSIGKMFTSEMTLASAWIHLIAVDLFAARQVFHDGLENQIETRHSVSLCLFFCPIGILTHIITKGLAKPTRKKEHHF